MPCLGLTSQLTKVDIAIIVSGIVKITVCHCGRTVPVKLPRCIVQRI